MQMIPAYISPPLDTIINGKWDLALIGKKYMQIRLLQNVFFF